MNRRRFLTGTAAGAAGIAAFALPGGAQAPTAPAGGQAPPAGGGQGRGGRGGGQAGPAGPPPLLGNPGAPANVPAWKLDRVSLMQLNFNAVMLPNPSATNPNPTPQNTNQQYTVFDLPKLYVEHYGVHAIEFQLDRIVRCETDPNFIKELKAKLDEHKMIMSQVNMEIGVAQGMTADAAGRRTGIDRLKKWVDICNQLGCKRMMGNQNQAMLTKEKFNDAVSYMKEVADAGRPSGVMFSMETRGATSPELQANLGMKAWEFMIKIMTEAGAHSNVDIGNVGATNQQELHDCIKAWYPRSTGNMHIKSNNNWNIGEAVRFTEGLGYKGRYAIEVGAWAGQRMTYNQILANVKNQFQEYKA